MTDHQLRRNMALELFLLYVCSNPNSQRGGQRLRIPSFLLWGLVLFSNFTVLSKLQMLSSISSSFYLNPNKICNHFHLWQGKQKKRADFFENKILLKYLVQFFFFFNVTVRCCIRWQEAKICFRTHSSRASAAVSCFGAMYFKHRLFDTVPSFCPEKRRLYLFHFLIQSSAYYYFCCPFYEIIFTENY